MNYHKDILDGSDRYENNENYLYIAERLYTKEDFIVSKNGSGIETYTLRSELPQSTLGGLLGPGDIKYKDINGDGIIDSYDKVRGVGPPKVPEIVYGFGLNIDIKDFMPAHSFKVPATVPFCWEVIPLKDGFLSHGE